MSQSDRKHLRVGGQQVLLVPSLHGSSRERTGKRGSPSETRSWGFFGFHVSWSFPGGGETGFIYTQQIKANQVFQDVHRFNEFTSRTEVTADLNRQNGGHLHCCSCQEPGQTLNQRPGVQVSPASDAWLLSTWLLTFLWLQSWSTLRRNAAAAQALCIRPRLRLRPETFRTTTSWVSLRTHGPTLGSEPAADAATSEATAASAAQATGEPPASWRL